MSSPAGSPASSGAAAPAAPAAASRPSVVVRPTSSSVTQWDRCMENGAIKTLYGATLGAIASVVLFRTGGARLATTGFAAGLGGGMAWYECKQAYAPTRFHNSLLTPAQNAAIASSPLCRCGKASCKCGPGCKCVPVGFATVQNGVVPTFDVSKKDGACCSK